MLFSERVCIFLAVNLTILWPLYKYQEIKLAFIREVLINFDNKSTLFSKFTTLSHHISQLKTGL